MYFDYSEIFGFNQINVDGLLAQYWQQCIFYSDFVNSKRTYKV